MLHRFLAVDAITIRRPGTRPPSSARPSPVASSSSPKAEHSTANRSAMPATSAGDRCPAAAVQAPAGFGRPSTGSPMRSAGPWPAASPVARRCRVRASMPSHDPVGELGGRHAQTSDERRPSRTRSSRARSGRSSVWAGRWTTTRSSSPCRRPAPDHPRGRSKPGRDLGPARGELRSAPEVWPGD